MKEYLENRIKELERQKEYDYLSEKVQYTLNFWIWELYLALKELELIELKNGK